MNTSILRIESLSTGYGSPRHQHRVAHHLTASLAKGSLTALIGVNGAGKSTLLRTLAGLQPALSGNIYWLDKEIADYSQKDLSKTLAVVLTERGMGNGLLVKDVVEMGRMPYTGFDGRLSPDDHWVAENSMRQTGILNLSWRKFESLSDGEKQRVLIAKALTQQTPVILLDEPTAFLDFPSKVSLLRLLKKLAVEEGKTIIVSTHDLELIFQIAKSLWLLSEDGMIQGSPKELATSGVIETFFHTDGLRFDCEQLCFTLDDF